LDGQERSCINFCTYHGKFILNKRTQYYAVIPDQDCASAPAAKRRDCKFGMPVLDATTAAISNVYVGAKTDPDNGPYSKKVVPRYGWVDRYSGKIQNYCVGPNDRVEGLTGVTWTVQQMWSNKYKSCLTDPTRPRLANAIFA
jgi:hypothetical protein